MKTREISEFVSAIDPALEAQRSGDNHTALEMLTGLLPRVLQDIARKRARDTRAQAALLSDFVLRVEGVRGMDQAQVAHGGADTREFDSGTLESRFHEGVYAAGEVLNVDGECGGFNLLFAWASGITAGRHAALSR